MKTFLHLVLASVLAGIASVSAANLERDFQHPPAEARPWVYWFWLNGNITSNGITADLEAMKRVGVGGALIMEVDQGAPVGPVDFMGTKWRELFKHVHAEARRLGLEINMNNDAGWNGSGGPWIKPEQSMQKVVFSETNVTGPTRFEAKLPQPEAVKGFYRDIAVLAFPSVGAYRVEGIKHKALYETGAVGFSGRTNLPPEMVIDRARLTDLTGRLAVDGRLSWDVPEGSWTILRVGHTSTGVNNAPAPRTGQGLECDKLSRAGIEANFEGMMAKLAADNRLTSAGLKHGLVATHIDSWENGAQNWTANMRAEFKTRRGYDLQPFLPVFTGRVVGSDEISERFLWDLRRTVSELVIENYAGRMRELAHEHGMRFTVEAYGGPCDCIAYGGRSDEPMGEFWTPSGAIETCKGMACAGHVYGKRIIGAESFTSGDKERWREHPGVLKALGDRVFCDGINRFVFHRYAMQPWSQSLRPGMTMGPWGQHYERTETWWEQSAPWHEYLARCQYLLRQGLFVADICYVQPETPPHGFDEHPRQGYDWDACGADAVLERMSVRDGRLVLPDGMSYRVLVLPRVPAMTPRLLSKVRDLAEAGATVIGAPPAVAPGLTDYPACDDAVKAIARDLWGDCDGVKVKERAFGKGKVIWAIEAEKALPKLGVAPDFTSAQPLRYIHRRAGETDIYFVCNPGPQELVTAATFRVAGKAPELWDPETGARQLAEVYDERGGLTTVSLALPPAGSVFVVFRESDGKRGRLVAIQHDGKALYSVLPQPPIPILIKKAVYGVLDDPARTRDARDQVQRIVDGGDRSFPVHVLAEGGDPAPQVIKTVLIDYAIGGTNFTVRAPDPQTVCISPDVAKVTVDKALYGVLNDPKRTRDVREKLQRLIDAGESSFRVARMAEGDDPAFLVVKTLDLEYTRDGRKIAVKGTDPELIDLKPAAPFQEPALLPSGTSRGARFVALRPGLYDFESAGGKRRRSAVAPADLPVERLDGPWRVRFAPGGGAPPDVTFSNLVSWSDHADPGVRYFSGTATYFKEFEVPRSLLARHKRLLLDLGEVEVMAEVTLNGKHLGLLWKKPYRMDVTEALRRGTNRLEVKVTNLWPNRMIGDERLPEDSERNPNGTLKSWPAWVEEGKTSPTGRFTFTSWRLWKATDPLLKSGLVGPVLLRSAQEVP